MSAADPETLIFLQMGKRSVSPQVTDKMEAISTNADLFIVPVAGGEAKRITTQPGVRRESGVFAGREIHRLSRAAGRGIRSGSLARAVF